MGDGKLKFQINMEEGRPLSIFAFLKTIKAFMDLLDACEKSETGKKRANQLWVITDMGIKGDKYFVEIQGLTGGRK